MSMERLLLKKLLTPATWRGMTLWLFLHSPNRHTIIVRVQAAKFDRITEIAQANNITFNATNNHVAARGSLHKTQKFELLLITTQNRLI